MDGQNQSGIRCPYLHYGALLGLIASFSGKASPSARYLPNKRYDDKPPAMPVTKSATETRDQGPKLRKFERK